MANIQTAWQEMKSTNLLVFTLSIYIVLALIFVSRDGISIWPFLHVAVIFVTGFIAWAIVNASREKKKRWPHLFITLAIITLVWHYSESWSDLIWPAVAALFAVLAKFFAYYRGVSLINPAVAGLLLAGLGVKLLEFLDIPASGFASWWGTNNAGTLSLILAILWLIAGTIKQKKHYLVLSFLITYAIILAALQQFSTLLFVATDATIYFLVGVMLLEPRTSPAMPRQQLIIGCIVATSYILMNQLGVDFGELWALVILGLITAYLKLKMLTPKPTTTT